MIQFYATDLRDSFTLGADETNHCLRVLRKKAGDIIWVTDGKGFRYECRIAGIGKRDLKLDILSEEFIPKSWNNRIILAVAPTKNADRMAWLVEKATEIGVDEIRFIGCRHNERKEVNIDRLNRNAVSAMTQSLKTRKPEIIGIKPLESIIGLKGEKYFGYCSPEIPKTEFVNEYKSGTDIVIAIGPEGDFSKAEVESLIEAGFRATTFGNERLRTETAALYGLTAVHVLNNKKT